MKVIGYTRVSTTDQADDGVSLAAQEAKIRQYADLYDIELVGIESDAGVSAKSLKRPGLQRALDALSRDEAQGLLITKLDRLTRSVVDLGTLVDKYFNKYELLSVSDNIDTRSASGRLVLNVLMSVAQWEREATAERTKDALLHLKNIGVQLGNAAMGWEHTEEVDSDGRRVIQIVESEVMTARRAWDLRRQGMSYRAVGDQLTKEGHETKRGGQWSAKVVRSIVGRMEESSETYDA